MYIVHICYFIMNLVYVHFANIRLYNYKVYIIVLISDSERRNTIIFHYRIYYYDKLMLSVTGINFRQVFTFARVYWYWVLSVHIFISYKDTKYLRLKM